MASMNWNNFLLWLDNILEDIWLGEKGTPYRDNNTTMEPNTTVISQEKAPSAPLPTKGDILYEAAFQALGKAIAPQNIAELGCAYSVDALYKRCFGKHIVPPPNNESTFWMYKTLKTSALFEQTSEPQAGDLIISPTNYGTGSLPHGHEGIVAHHRIMR